MKKRLERLAWAIIFLFVYYVFLFDFAIAISDSIVSWMSSNNMTTIEIPMKEWNSTTNTWETKPRALDLAGFFDLLLKMVIFFLPLIILWRVGL